MFHIYNENMGFGDGGSTVRDLSKADSGMFMGGGGGEEESF